MSSGSSFDPFRLTDAAPFVFVHDYNPARDRVVGAIDEIVGRTVRKISRNQERRAKRGDPKVNSQPEHNEALNVAKSNPDLHSSAAETLECQASEAYQPASLRQYPLLSPAVRSCGTQHGWNPNISWRAVAMHELRAHPSFIALPPASFVNPTSTADLRLFRQDSGQWWALHAGRITTSAFASCLGVWEEKTARALGVPRSLRGRGKALDAHVRLTLPLLDDLALLHPQQWPTDDDQTRFSAEPATAIWRLCDVSAMQHPSPFLYAFHPLPRHASHMISGAGQSISRIRMQWGSAQEATAILSAVNFFGKRNAVVEECGLQPLEALSVSQYSKLPPGLPPMGASPDAIIRWPNGTVEPLEVKSHAPFTATAQCALQAAALPYEVRDPGPYAGVAVWHIPQLYLHMLCLGEACSSALFMSASATRGINVFRIRRDASLMKDMLGFTALFCKHYGRGHQPPPPNFFWGLPGYAQLLDKLKSASRRHIELVGHIPEAEVQRGTNENLFSD